MPITPPSTPPSPVSSVPNPNHNSLIDVFSDSPPSTPTKATVFSDIPRLRSTHATAGYREGLSSSKLNSLQVGFDEGYSFGAVFGLKIGYILGALESLCCAYTMDLKARENVMSLTREAGEELVLEKIFGKNYWDPNGVWTYEVKGQGGEPTIHEVADQHPLLRSWNERVSQELGTSGLHMGRFEGKEWEAGRLMN